MRREQSSCETDNSWRVPFDHKRISEIALVRLRSVVETFRMFSHFWKKWGPTVWRDGQAQMWILPQSTSQNTLELGHINKRWLNVAHSKLEAEVPQKENMQEPPYNRRSGAIAAAITTSSAYASQIRLLFVVQTGTNRHTHALCWWCVDIFYYYLFNNCSFPNRSCDNW